MNKGKSDFYCMLKQGICTQQGNYHVAYCHYDGECKHKEKVVDDSNCFGCAKEFVCGKESCSGFIGVHDFVKEQNVSCTVEAQCVPRKKIIKVNMERMKQ